MPQFQAYKINSTNLEDRWDVYFYQPIFIDIIKYHQKYKMISDYVRVKGGKRLPAGSSYSPEKTEYKYIRAIDIKDGTVKTDNLQYISENQHHGIKRYVLRANDVVITIAGTIGEVGIVPNGLEICNFTENISKLEIKDKNLLLPKYLYLVLKSNFVQLQLKRERIQTGVPKLSLERIEQLRIPDIPDISTQERIATLFDQAKKERDEKLKKAEELESRIENYLFTELGIKVLKVKNKRFFGVEAEDLENRWDPYFYTEEYIQNRKVINKSRYVNKPLKELVNFGTENINPPDKFKDVFTYIDLSSVDTKHGEISEPKIINVKEAPSRARQLVKTAQILVASLSGSSDTIALVPNEYNGSVASTGFHVLNCKKDIMPEYLYFVMRTSLLRKELERIARGTIMSTSSEKDLENIMIPLPPVTIQKKIAGELLRDIWESKQLRWKVESDFQKAKQKIEKMILGRNNG